MGKNRLLFKTILRTVKDYNILSLHIPFEFSSQADYDYCGKLVNINRKFWSDTIKPKTGDNYLVLGIDNKGNLEVRDYWKEDYSGININQALFKELTEKNFDKEKFKKFLKFLAGKDNSFCLFIADKNEYDNLNNLFFEGKLSENYIGGEKLIIINTGPEIGYIYYKDKKPIKSQNSNERSFKEFIEQINELF